MNFAELRDGIDLTLYFYNIAANPCFLVKDDEFLYLKRAIVYSK